MRYSKGIMWLEDCRIPFVESDKEKINFDRPRLRNKEGTDWILTQAMDYTNPDYKEYNQKGRYTPNLLCCDDALNDGTITKQSKRTYKPTEHKGSLFGNSSQGHGEGIGDKGTNSRYYNLDLWFDRMVERLE